MEKNRKYSIRVLINGALLTYTGVIISDEDGFVTFTDRFGNKVSVNKMTIQSYEELR